jgi:hypothetical protein
MKIGVSSHISGTSRVDGADGQQSGEHNGGVAGLLSNVRRHVDDVTGNLGGNALLHQKVEPELVYAKGMYVCLIVCAR